jgi:hypothetical protein
MDFSPKYERVAASLEFSLYKLVFVVVVITILLLVSMNILSGNDG